MTALRWRRAACGVWRVACGLVAPLLCVLLLAVPVGGLALWVQVQQAGYVDVCLPALLGGACVFVMPGDLDLTWG